MAKTSAAMLKAIDKYNKSKDEIKLRLAKGQKDFLQTYVKEYNEKSLNEFISKAITEKIERDNPQALKEGNNNA